MWKKNKNKKPYLRLSLRLRRWPWQQLPPLINIYAPLSPSPIPDSASSPPTQSLLTFFSPSSLSITSEGRRHLSVHTPGESPANVHRPHLTAGKLSPLPLRAISYWRLIADVNWAATLFFPYSLAQCFNTSFWSICAFILLSFIIFFFILLFLGRV